MNPGSVLRAGRPVDYFAAIRRNRRLLLLLPALGLILGVLVGRLQKPVYQARVALEVTPVNENFLNSREVVRGGALTEGSIEPYIQAQSEVVREDSLLARVVENLGLDKRQDFGGSKAAAVKTLSSRMTVAPVVAARMLRIAYDSEDPALAAKIVNAIASEYLQHKTEAKIEAARTTSKWLSDQSTQMREKMERAERELQAYAKSSGLLYTNDKDTTAEEKLRMIERELSTAESDRIAKQSMVAMAAASNPNMLPQAMASNRVQEYEGKITELRRQRAELLALLTPENYKVQRLDGQIAEVEAALKSEMERIPERMRNEYSAAQKRESLLLDAYARQAQHVSEDGIKAIHYATLKQQVETTRAVYAAMAQRTEQAAMMAALPESNVRLLAAAEPPMAPYKPNRALLGVLGLFMGMIAAVVFSGLREVTDRTIKAPGESISSLNLPELGVIPSAKVDRKALAQRGWNGRRREGTNFVERISDERAHSILAESFRSALTSIYYTPGDRHGARVLVFTSPGPHEGKTTVVSNLGFTLAGIGRSVLLINADCRHPRLDQVFDVREALGLTDLLDSDVDVETCDLEPYISRTSQPLLCVMASGSSTGNISRLFHGDRLRLLMNRLRSEFDLVLIDSPPAIQISDSRVLARSSDGVVLVLRAGATTFSAAAEAAARFLADSTPVLGTILNDWDPKVGDTETLRAFSRMYNHYYQSSST